MQNRIARAGQPALDLTWDAQYRLTAVSTNGVVVEAYGYDPLGRRAYTATATSSGIVTNWHAYVGMHCVADLDDSGAVIRSYTWGSGIDNLLAMTVHGVAETNTYYALTDHLGTVHALVSSVDSVLSVVESYSYDAWGNVLAVYDAQGSLLPASSLGNRFLFQGREHSFATGLTNFRARWYDPQTGRWLSNDPIGISGGLNQYVFCGNDPVDYVDPSGLCEEDRAAKSRPYSFEDWVRYPEDILRADMRGNLGGERLLPQIGAEPGPPMTWRDAYDREVRPHSSLLAASMIVVAAGTACVPGGRLRPDLSATGPHTTFRRDPRTGRVTHYETWKPQSNPRDPKPWESVIRYDRTGEPHYNKATRLDVPAPHVHGPGIPGGVRSASPGENPQ